MTNDNPNSFFHTNFQVFYKIAQESYKAMNDHLNSCRRPKSNDEPGYIITHDPDQKSFKHAFITIVFCGVFLESMLHLLIVEREGLEVFEEYDRKPYEEKLKLLGCNDQSIIDLCKGFRKARKEVVHEKAYINAESFRVAEEEAENAIKLINRLVAYFNLEMA